MFVRVSFPDPLRAQQIRTRQPFTVSIYEPFGRTRECLTLIPSQPANAVCWRAPARHHWFSNVILGVPFATPRVRWTPQVIESISRIPTVKCWRMFLRRGVRQPNLVASLLAGEMQSAWLHRADTCARASHQVSARFRPQPLPDSPALHPLHSNRSIPAFRHKNHWLHAWLPLIRSVGRKQSRPSQKRLRPQMQNGRETTSGQQQ